jgi:ERCC4-type nuclease
VFIVWGNLQEELLYRKIRRETYFQYLAGVTIHRCPEGKHGSISVVNFDTDFDVCMFLKTLHKLIVTDDIYRDPSVKKVKVTEENRALLNLSRLPNVGPTRAKALLEKFKTVRRVYCATIEELDSVDTIGKKISEGIVDFVTKEHKEEK